MLHSLQRGSRTAHTVLEDQEEVRLECVIRLIGSLNAIVGRCLTCMLRERAAAPWRHHLECRRRRSARSCDGAEFPRAALAIDINAVRSMSELLITGHLPQRTGPASCLRMGALIDPGGR